MNTQNSHNSGKQSHHTSQNDENIIENEQERKITIQNSMKNESQSDDENEEINFYQNSSVVKKETLHNQQLSSAAAPYFSQGEQPHEILEQSEEKTEIKQGGSSLIPIESKSDAEVIFKTEQLKETENIIENNEESKIYENPEDVKENEMRGVKGYHTEQSSKELLNSVQQLPITPVHTYAPRLHTQDAQNQQVPRRSKDDIIVTMIDVDFSNNQQNQLKPNHPNNPQKPSFSQFQFPSLSDQNIFAIDNSNMNINSGFNTMPSNRQQQLMMFQTPSKKQLDQNNIFMNNQQQQQQQQHLNNLQPQYRHNTPDRIYNHLSNKQSLQFDDQYKFNQTVSQARSISPSPIREQNANMFFGQGRPGTAGVGMYEVQRHTQVSAFTPFTPFNNTYQQSPAIALYAQTLENKNRQLDLQLRTLQMQNDNSKTVQLLESENNFLRSKLEAMKDKQSQMEKQQRTLELQNFSLTRQVSELKLTQENQSQRISQLEQQLRQIQEYGQIKINIPSQPLRNEIQPRSLNRQPVDYNIKQQQFDLITPYNDLNKSSIVFHTPVALKNSKEVRCYSQPRYNSNHVPNNYQQQSENSPSKSRIVFNALQDQESPMFSEEFDMMNEVGTGEYERKPKSSQGGLPGINYLSGGKNSLANILPAPGGYMERQRSQIVQSNQQPSMNTASRYINLSKYLNDNTNQMNKNQFQRQNLNTNIQDEEDQIRTRKNSHNRGNNSAGVSQILNWNVLPNHTGCEEISPLKTNNSANRNVSFSPTRVPPDEITSPTPLPYLNNHNFASSYNNFPRQAFSPTIVQQRKQTLNHQSQNYFRDSTASRNKFFNQDTEGTNLESELTDKQLKKDQLERVLSKYLGQQKRTDSRIRQKMLEEEIDELNKEISDIKGKLRKTKKRSSQQN